MKSQSRGPQAPRSWPSLVGDDRSATSTSRRPLAEVLGPLGWAPKKPCRCGSGRFRPSSPTAGFAAGVVGTVLAFQSTPFVSNLGHALLATWIGALCGFWILWGSEYRGDRA